jgi:hypothetical protein
VVAVHSRSSGFSSGDFFVIMETLGELEVANLFIPVIAGDKESGFVRRIHIEDLRIHENLHRTENLPFVEVLRSDLAMFHSTETPRKETALRKLFSGDFLQIRKRIVVTSPLLFVFRSVIGEKFIVTHCGNSISEF